MFTVVAVSWLLVLLPHVHSVCRSPLPLENGRYNPVKDIYQPKDHIHYTCNQGYYSLSRDNGKDHTFEFKCQYVSRWSAIVDGRAKEAYTNASETFAWLPQCVASESCDVPSLDASVHLDEDAGQGFYEAGETIRFRCRNVGAVIVGLENATCLHTGQWSASVPTCVVPSICRVPPASHYMYLEPNVNQLSPGQSLKYICNHGYQIVFNDDEIIGEGEDEDRDEDDFRTHIRTCLVDGILDGWEPKCELFTCKKGLTSIEHGRSYFLGNGSEAEVGDSVHYRCDATYRVIGDNIQRCTLYAGWVGKKPFCGLKYCTTPRLKNGEVTPKKNILLSGDAAQFSCFRGYTLLGPSKLTCTDNLAWDTAAITVCHPRHDASPCMDLGVPHNGYRFVTHTVGRTVIHYGCEDSFKMSGKKKLVCKEAKGKWNGVPPRCKSVYSFPDPHQEALRLLGRITQLRMSSPAGRADATVSLQPSHIYLLMDLSGSQANDSIKSAVNFLKPIIKNYFTGSVYEGMSIIGFTDTAEVVLGPTEDLGRIILTLEDLTSRTGGTNIAAALAKVLDEDHEQENVTNIVVLASDGQYNAGGNPHHNARALQEAGFELLILTMSVSMLSQEMEKLTSNSANDTFYLHENNFIDDTFELRLENDYSKCGQTEPAYTRPWMVNIEWAQQSVPGVIVGTRWVLALHTDGLPENTNLLTVRYGGGLQREMGILSVSTKMVSNEVGFMLLQLADELDMSPAARPVCLPVPIQDRSNDYFRPYPSTKLYSVGTQGMVLSPRNSQRAHIVTCANKQNARFCADAIGVTPSSSEAEEEEDYDNEEEDYDYEEEDYDYEEEDDDHEEQEDYHVDSVIDAVPVVLPGRSRRMITCSDGDAFVAVTHNRFDLGDMRVVLSGFYSQEADAFVKVELLGRWLHDETTQKQEL